MWKCGNAFSRVRQNLQTLKGYIFHILQYFTTKLHNFIKFRKLFPTVLKLFSNLKVCLIGEWSEAALLQNDLKYLEHWSSILDLTFIEPKCKQQRITRKIRPVTPTSMLKDYQLDAETTDTKRDLGLCWYPVISPTSSFANCQFANNVA